MKTATDHQGMTTEREMEATVTGSIEATVTVTAATGTETEEVAAGAEMTDVSAIDTIAARETIMTIRDIPPTMKMTGVVTITEVHAKTKDTDFKAEEEGEEVVTIWDPPAVTVADEAEVVVVVAAGDRTKKE